MSAPEDSNVAGAPQHFASEMNANPTAEQAAANAAGAQPETELDPIAAQSQQLEEERRKLEESQAEVNNEESEHREGKEEVDARSVYVGNVEYAAQAQDLEKHFQPAGAINRVNIMLNKVTGQPKGYAYIEFAEPSMVMNAILLNNTEFFGRQSKVVPKRTNIPGINRGGFRGRGRGRGGRGGFRGGFRGGRGSFRGRGRGGYTPY